MNIETDILPLIYLKGDFLVNYCYKKYGFSNSLSLKIIEIIIKKNFKIKLI